MNVLIACEESQRVCIEFRKLGHNAYSCDIEPCSGGHPEWHIQQDALTVIDGFCEFNTADGNIHRITGMWDMLIAHPPCTYLSNAGARWLYTKKGVLNLERYEKGVLAKAFFMRFYTAKCDKICVENPIPSKIYGLPPYTCTVQPFEHGEPFSKKTCLWIKGLPKLRPTCILEKHTPFIPAGTSRKDKSKYGHCSHDSESRSKTFPGIAKAMAAQWGTIECEEEI